MIASLYKIARGKSRRKRKKPHRAAVGVAPCGDPPVGSRQSFVTRCASRQRETGSREGNVAPPYRALSASPITIRGLHVQTSPVSPCGRSTLPAFGEGKEVFPYESVILNPKLPCLPRRRGAGLRRRPQKAPPFEAPTEPAGETGAVAPQIYRYGTAKKRDGG